MTAGHATQATPPPASHAQPHTHLRPRPHHRPRPYASGVRPPPCLPVTPAGHAHVTVRSRPHAGPPPLPVTPTGRALTPRSHSADYAPRRPRPPTGHAHVTARPRPHVGPQLPVTPTGHAPRPPVTGVVTQLNDHAPRRPQPYLPVTPCRPRPTYRPRPTPRRPQPYPKFTPCRPRPCSHWPRPHPGHAHPTPLAAGCLWSLFGPRGLCSMAHGPEGSP